jgi:hypothetical protein
VDFSSAFVEHRIEIKAVRILTIFTRHGTSKYASAERELDELFDTQLPSVERDVVVVDTALTPGVLEQAGRRTLLGSDNEAWEFSAIDTAVRFLGHRVWAYDLVNVATSAFRQLYVGYLDRFTRAVLQAIDGQPVCLGHIDCYNEPIRVLEYVSQHWIRTSCFFLPPGDLGILQPARSAGGRERWFSGDPAQPFRDDAPLSSGYCKLIVDWLTGGDTGQGVTWHSAMALDAARLALFEQKALAILNEHLFAIRLRASGCRLVDVTWLSTRVGNGSHQVDWNTPWWRQIAERHADAVHVTPGGIAQAL